MFGKTTIMFAELLCFLMKHMNTNTGIVEERGKRFFQRLVSFAQEVLRSRNCGECAPYMFGTPFMNMQMHKA